MHLTLGHVISDFIWRIFTSLTEGLASSALTMAASKSFLIGVNFTFTWAHTEAPKDWLAFTAPDDLILKRTWTITWTVSLVIGKIQNYKCCFLGLSSVIMLAVIRNFSEKINFLAIKIRISESQTYVTRSKRQPYSLKWLDFQMMRKFPALIDLFEASYYQFIRLKNY
jgi:hypothetical protein